MVIRNTVAEPSNVFLMYFLYLGQKAMGFFQKQRATELPSQPHFSIQAIDFGIANEGTVTSTEEVTIRPSVLGKGLAGESEILDKSN